MPLVPAPTITTIAVMLMEVAVLIILGWQFFVYADFRKERSGSVSIAMK